MLSLTQIGMHYAVSSFLPKIPMILRCLIIPVSQPISEVLFKAHNASQWDVRM